ncbi:hypothetical protein ATCC90586_005646 [Pythium insidiosum]|nr:hypothetical protein ATCC90586_005646 [Pythium insidiosum]
MESLRRLTSSLSLGGGSSAASSHAAASVATPASALPRSQRRQSPPALSAFGTIDSALAAAVSASGLDLTFITDRFLVTGCPVVGPTDLAAKQNNVDDLADFLEARFGSQYLLLDLSGIDEGPENLVERLREQVLDFGWSRAGMRAHTPPLDLIFRICYAIFAWLSLDPAHVALVHCQNGKTRTGVVVACYLMYARLADEPMEALAAFYRQRLDMRSLTPDSLRLKTPPSIRRFLAGFHEVVENQRVPNEKPLLLKAIMIHALPVASRPRVEIWDDYRMTFSTAEPMSSSLAVNGPATMSPPVIDWSEQDGFFAILWEKGLDVDGGFSVLCSFGDVDDGDERIDESDLVLFRYT